MNIRVAGLVNESIVEAFTSRTFTPPRVTMASEKPRSFSGVSGSALKNPRSAARCSCVMPQKSKDIN